MSQPMRKVNAARASDVYQHFEIDPQSVKLDDAGVSPDQFLATLIAGERMEDAVKFLAHAMPKREAVWWACLAARTVTNRDGVDEELKSALKAAEKWVYEPTEPNRRAAEKLAEKTNYKHPASWAAVAAFWSGGSVTGENDPPVPPPPYLYAHAVSGAVMLAASLDDPDQITPKLNAFLRQGIDIANGGNGQVA